MRSLLLMVICTCVTLVTVAQGDDVATFSSLRIKSSGGDGDMMDFSLSRSHRYIIVATENHKIKVLDGRTGKYIRTLRGYPHEVVEVIILPDDKHFLSIGDDKSIAVLDLNTGEVVNKSLLPSKSRCADVNKAGNELVIGDSDGKLHFIEIPSLKIIQSIDSEEPEVTAVSYNSDFTKLAAATSIGVGNQLKKRPIFVFDAESKTLVSKLAGIGGRTMSLKFSDDGKALYCGHNKSGVRKLIKWDIASGANEDINSVVGGLSNSTYVGLEVDDINGVLLATTDDRSIEIYDLKTKEQIAKKSRGKMKMVTKVNHSARYTFRAGANTFILGGFNKNLLYIFNTETRSITGYIHTINEDWAVVAADGRMEGSEGAIQNISWKGSAGEIPLENTFSAKFTPKLLSLLVTEKQSLQEFEVAKVFDAIPSVMITKINGQTVTPGADQKINFTSSQKKVVVTVSAIKNADKIKNIKIHQNAKLIGQQDAHTDSKAEYIFELSLTDAWGPENYIYVSAESSSGVDSEKQYLVVNYTGKSDSKPVFHLITVGIDKYRNPKYNLNFGTADADALQQALAAGASSIYEQVNSVVIRDKDATKERILSEVEKIQHMSKEQDLFVFYFAGHGVVAQDQEGASEFYLVPTDVTQLYGQQEVLNEKGISAKELKTLSKNINAQKQIFILDACQSSGALETFALRGAAEEKAIAQIARATGTYWITATGTEQFASEFEELKHGVFTYALLEGLKGLADNGDRKISIKELSAYVESRVPELSEKYKGTEQFPSSYSFGNDFPIVIVKD